MPLEIERKFLVEPCFLDQCTPSVSYPIKQCYLTTDPDKTIRLRIKGAEGFLTIKSRSTGITRLEFEYQIPANDTEQMMRLYGTCFIEKTRHEVEYAGNTWEVDVFEGDNKGLIVAEIELDDETDTFEKPEWILEEVTFDKRYANSNLVRMPYSKW